MTEPQATSPTYDYAATLVGTWSPDTLPALTNDALVDAIAAASRATAELLGLGQHVQFHLLATDTPGGAVYRSLWRVAAQAAGPALHAGTRAEHDSEIGLVLRMVDHTERTQVIVDQTMRTMPYQGILAPGVVALLLRDMFGQTAREIAIPGFGVGRFAPEAVRYRDTFGWSTVWTPIDAHAADMASYRFVAPISDSPPAMWLAITDDAGHRRTWQVSYCVDDPGKGPSQRWDAEQPAPDFEELPWPAPQQQWTMPVG